MRTLILMRHAKSSWADPTTADHDRPLNDRGQLSAAAMGDWLRANGHLPDTAICSTARRTRETFAGLGLDIPVTFSRGLYHADPAAIMDHLHEADGDAVLILAHNPGIAAFAGMILSVVPDHHRFVDYPTGATLVARFDADRWNAIGWHQGQPIGFAIPREVMNQPTGGGAS